MIARQLALHPHAYTRLDCAEATLLCACTTPHCSTADLLPRQVSIPDLPSNLWNGMRCLAQADSVFSTQGPNGLQVGL